MSVHALPGHDQNSNFEPVLDSVLSESNGCPGVDVCLSFQILFTQNHNIIACSYKPCLLSFAINFAVSYIRVGSHSGDTASNSWCG